MLPMSSIYRQLSGGVTTSQLLHGSSHPIGGAVRHHQTTLGLPPEEMKFEGADGFIKFALGETSSKSNWGDDNTIRFPPDPHGA